MNEFCELPLEQVRESLSNPRRRFDEAKLAELAESVRTKGVLEPILVRRVEDANGYEIVAGARRFRAARMAGLETISARVCNLTETEALEVQVIENGQREDVHPLEEAFGYRTLLAKAQYDVGELAARVGKSIAFVYARLKLTELSEELQAAFLEGKITAGHAILIARHDPKDQVKALQYCEPPAWDPDQVTSVRDLQSWIKRNLQCSLERADFPLDSVDLLPVAGSCSACPHRLGNAPDFDPTEDLPNVYTRPECFEQKETAYETSIAPPPPPPQDPPPPVAKPARTKPSKEEKEREAERARAAAEERERIRQREEKEQQERQAKLDQEKESRLRILRAVLEKVKWPPRREELADLIASAVTDLPEALDGVLGEVGVAPGVTFFKLAEDLRKLPEQRLAQVLVLLFVCSDFDGFSFAHGCDKLTAAAKRYGVDAAKIRAQAEGGTRKEVPAKAKAQPAKGVKSGKVKPTANKMALTMEIRKRIAEAQRKRWAEHRRQEQTKGKK